MTSITVTMKNGLFYVMVHNVSRVDYISRLEGLRCSQHSGKVKLPYPSFISQELNNGSSKDLSCWDFCCTVPADLPTSVSFWANFEPFEQVSGFSLLSLRCLFPLLFLFKFMVRRKILGTKSRPIPVFQAPRQRVLLWLWVGILPAPFLAPGSPDEAAGPALEEAQALPTGSLHPCWAHSPCQGPGGGVPVRSCREGQQPMAQPQPQPAALHVGCWPRGPLAG